MASISQGMNIEEVETIGRSLQHKQAESVRNAVRQIESLVGSTSRMWVGTDAERFRSWWPSKRSVMLAMADDLEGFGQSALSNAAEQRKASDAMPLAFSGKSRSGGRLPAYSLGSTTHTTDGDLSIFGVVGGHNQSDVVVTRLSDGRYSVSFRFVSGADAGIGVKRLLEAAGIKLPIDLGDLGTGVGTEGGYSFEFLTTDKASASDLAELLRGEVWDPESIQGIVTDPDVSWGGLTLINAGASADGAAKLGTHGFEGEVAAHTETTYNADGSVVHRSITTSSIGGDGWDESSKHETSTEEIVVGADGQVESVTIEKSTTQLSDTRDGFEKTAEAITGAVPFVSQSVDSLDVTTIVTNQSYDVSNMTSEMLSAASSGDSDSFARLAEGSSELASESKYTYEGSVSGDSVGGTVGILGGSSGSEYTNIEMTSGEFRAAGSDDWMQLESGDSEMSPQVITHEDGTQETVWTTTF